MQNFESSLLPTGMKMMIEIFHKKAELSSALLFYIGSPSMGVI